MTIGSVLLSYLLASEYEAKESYPLDLPHLNLEIYTYMDPFIFFRHQDDVGHLVRVLGDQ